MKRVYNQSDQYQIKSYNNDIIVAYDIDIITKSLNVCPKFIALLTSKVYLIILLACF